MDNGTGPLVKTLGGVSINGEAVTQRQRALVAALALHRKSGATVDMLVDAIWGDRAPSSARKSLQNQISRLRQTFGSGLIRTESDRYVLTARTDIDEVDRLWLELSSTRPESDLRHQIASLTALLGSWTGEPFADLPDDSAAAAERARLDLRHCRFVEMLALARLTADETDRQDAIVDLRVRVALHPFHEHAWELLVTTLYLSGRRTEALGTCAEFSDILQDQLGVAPSHSFRRLRAVVESDQRLDPAEFFSSNPEPCRSALLLSA